MSITIQQINASDDFSSMVNKINTNFNQVLLNGGGPAGTIGPRGYRGLTGFSGIRGSLWFSGTNAPQDYVFIDNEQPLNHDLYLSSNGNIYKSNNGQWSYTNINIRGPQGLTGTSKFVDCESQTGSLRSYYVVPPDTDLGALNNNNVIRSILLGGYGPSEDGNGTISTNYHNNINSTNNGILHIYSYNASTPQIILSGGSNNNTTDISYMPKIASGPYDNLILKSDRLTTNAKLSGIDILTQDSNIELVSARDIILNTIGTPISNNVASNPTSVGNIHLISKDIYTSAGSSPVDTYNTQNEILIKNSSYLDSTEHSFAQIKISSEAKDIVNPRYVSISSQGSDFYNELLLSNSDKNIILKSKHDIKIDLISSSNNILFKQNGNILITDNINPDSLSYYGSSNELSSLNVNKTTNQSSAELIQGIINSKVIYNIDTDNPNSNSKSIRSSGNFYTSNSIDLANKQIFSLSGLTSRIDINSSVSTAFGFYNEYNALDINDSDYNGYGIYTNMKANMSTGSIYGNYINFSSSGSAPINVYGLYLNAAEAYAHKGFGIYENGFNSNFFSNSIGIGTTNFNYTTNSDLNYHDGNSSSTWIAGGMSEAKLSIEGTILASAIKLTSDRRLKENIIKIKDGLNTIMKLNPVNFNFISDKTKSAGFIAQDVLDLIPESVINIKSDKFEDGQYSLDYNAFIPYLTSAVQILNKTIEEKNIKILELENEIEKIKVHLGL